MHKMRHSARHGDAQAPHPQPIAEQPDVAAFIALHGVTKCEPGARTEQPKKSVSAKRQRRKRKPHPESWTFRRAWWREKSRERLLAWINRRYTD